MSLFSSSLEKKHWILLAVIFIIACGIVLTCKILLDRQREQAIDQFREMLLPGSKADNRQ